MPALSKQQAQTFLEQIELNQTGPNSFVSTRPPGQLGQRKPIAYGGCTTAVAVYAACKTVQPEFNLYSILGSFLGPSLTDRPLHCEVQHVRDTKAFATRRVVLSQRLDNGQSRSCLQLTAEFQAPEPSVLYEFSPPYALPVKGPDHYLPAHDLRDRFVERGTISAQRSAIYDEMFSLMARFWDWRPCPEGVGGQNLSCFANHLPTTQDDRAMSDKITVEWQKAKGYLGGKSEQLAALAFNMDGGLAFLPLMHDHKFVDGASIYSSLDFALRIFADNVDLTKWHLKERRAIAANGGRTYSEARLFDEAGKLLAIESQQSIMRPPVRPKAAGKL